MKISLSLVLLACCGVTGAAYAQTETYPSAPIKIIAPDKPGGNFDIGARLLGESLARQLGQPVVVENRPGASTMIGARYVANAKPDGYTLLYTGSMHATLSQVVKDVPFDPVKDFTPIAFTATTPLIVAVHKDAPYADIGQLMADVKARPGDLTTTSLSPGSGTEIAVRDFAAKTDAQLRLIPYIGGAAATIALLAKEIDFAFLAPVLIDAQLQAGNARALAVTTTDRVKSRPDTPTLHETVAPGYSYDAWFVLLGPKGLPADITEKLNHSVAEFLKEDKTKQYHEKTGMIEIPMTTNEARDYFDSQNASLVKTAQSVGLGEF